MSTPEERRTCLELASGLLRETRSRAPSGTRTAAMMISKSRAPGSSSTPTIDPATNPGSPGDKDASEPPCGLVLPPVAVEGAGDVVEQVRRRDRRARRAEDAHLERIGPRWEPRGEAVSLGIVPGRDPAPFDC